MQVDEAAADVQRWEAQVQMFQKELPDDTVLDDDDWSMLR
jgi:hypothetical protein